MSCICDNSIYCDDKTIMWIKIPNQNFNLILCKYVGCNKIHYTHKKSVKLLITRASDEDPADRDKSSK